MITVLFSRRCAQSVRYQIYRRVIEQSELNSHPNVLRVIRVSDGLFPDGPFPVCIMSPWMPDGNIFSYVLANASANRWMLVRAHQPGN